MNRLEGMNAIITGASSGIGYESAIAFAKEGCNLVIHYNNNKDGIEELNQELKQYNIKVHTVKADVSKRIECDRIITESVDFLQSIDILFHNAGTIIKRMTVEEITDELIDDVIDINLKSCIWLSRKIIPVFKSQNHGKIIFVSSLAARMGGGPGAGVYGATKGGVLTFTKALANELGKYNVLVNNIAPGVIETPFHEQTSAEVMQAFADRTPIKRNGKPEEIASAAVYLASQESNFLTGATLDINGGFYMM